MKFIPYIYILLFLIFPINGFSQRKKITIKNIDQSEQKIIDSILKEKQKSVRLDTFSIETYQQVFLKKGFLNHQIEKIIDNDSLEVFQIALREKYPMLKINIKDNELLSFLENDQSYIVIPIDQTDIFLEKIVNFYNEKSYPFAKIKLDHIEVLQDTINASLHINTFDKREIDSIIVKGYDKMPLSYLRNKLGINNNNTITPNRIKQISNDLDKIAFINQSQTPQSLFTPGKTTLYIYIEEKKSSSFDGLIGFSNAEDNKIRLYGNINLKLLNSFHKAEEIQVKWTSSQNRSQDFKSKFYYPYIFNSYFSTAYQLNLFKKDSTYLNINHHGKLDYEISGNQHLGILMDIGHSIQTNKSTTAPIENFQSYFLGLSYIYSIPFEGDNFKDKLLLQSDFSRGKRNSKEQYKAYLYIQYLIPFLKKQSIIWRNKTELLLSEEYLENELFRLGGIESIRGFDENQFYSTAYNLSSIEYNYMISRHNYLSMMVDYAYIEEKLSHANNQLYSFGIGYTQQLKFGNLQLIYAIGNNTSQSFNFKNAKFHIKLTQNF